MSTGKTPSNTLRRAWAHSPGTIEDGGNGVVPLPPDPLVGEAHQRERLVADAALPVEEEPELRAGRLVLDPVVVGFGDRGHHVLDLAVEGEVAAHG